MTASGFAGDTGATSPPFIPADGVAGHGVPAPSCASGGASVPARPLGLGITPTLPTTVTQASTPVPPLSGGTLLTLVDGTTAVATDPDRDQVYFVDLTSNTVRATTALTAGDEPGRVIEDDAGRVHVVLRRGGAIATLDAKTGALSARRAVCPAPRGIVYQASVGLLQVACAGGELVSLPPAAGAATRTVMLDRDLRDVVLGAGGNLLVSTFRKAEVLSVGADGKIASRMQPGSGVAPPIMGPAQHRSPSVAWRMVSLGDTVGSVVMLHQTGVDDPIDLSMGYAGLKGCGGIVQAGVTVIAPGTTPQLANGINMVSLAVDLAVSPDKSRVAIAVPGNAETSGFPTIVEGSMDVFTQPTPSPCGAAGSVVQNPPPGQVVAVSYSASGVLLAQTREPATLWRGDTGATLSLAADPRTDTGNLIFHVNAGGGLACASCHPEGGEDGRVWNFSCVGARRTQSIRGGISPTAPFHWDGSENDFSHLMDDVFTTRMAGPMLSDPQKKSLQAWVDTIPAMPANAGLDAAAVARGKAVFNDAQVACASCHAGTLLTNNTTVDVGTGQALQVPSLRGVSWRGPFMHNGCAATLGDRFGDATCGGGDKHGVTSKLSTTQVGDLTAYLQSL
ncbi:MAG TPA: cytochrome c [Polyangia bacterium]